jgi:predicted PilT family ATPase
LETGKFFRRFVGELHALDARDPERPMISAREFNGKHGNHFIYDYGTQFNYAPTRSVRAMCVPFSTLRECNPAILKHVSETEAYRIEATGEAVVVIPTGEPVEFGEVVATTKRMRAEQDAERERVEAENRARAEAEAEKLRLRREADPTWQRKQLEERLMKVEAELAASRATDKKTPRKSGVGAT